MKSMSRAEYQNIKKSKLDLVTSYLVLLLHHFKIFFSFSLYDNGVNFASQNYILYSFNSVFIFIDITSIFSVTYSILVKL